MLGYSLTALDKVGAISGERMDNIPQRRPHPLVTGSRPLHPLLSPILFSSETAQPALDDKAWILFVSLLLLCKLVGEDLFDFVGQALAV